MLALLALTGCGTSDKEDPPGVYVARIGSDVRVRRASSEEARLVPLEATLVGTFCGGGESYPRATSPNGSARASVRSEHTTDAHGFAEDKVSLDAVEADGTQRRSYGTWAWVGGFAWSPDARHIAISADGRIWIVEPYRPGRRRVTQPGYQYEDVCPVWIDRRTIAFYRHSPPALP